MDVDWCFKNYLNHRHLKSSDDVREQLKIILQKMSVFVKDDYPLQINAINVKKWKKLHLRNFKELSNCCQMFFNLRFLRDNSIML